MKKLTAIIGALILTTGSAFAGDEAKDAKTFSDLDKDSNGALSEEEASADRTIAGVFAQADTNQDGYLTMVEYDRAVNEEEDAE